MKDYYVYITTNQKKTVLYIGMTNNLTIRLDEHFQDSIRSKKSFAGKYNCFHLIYFEKLDNPKEAIRREKEIKKWSRKKKTALIESLNSEWNFLERDLL
ncbi:GIY-YIG nuclease family protein [Gramella lutea]|uniref:GIY-YIG nuclease family protein n=1 Tax=Christiangramia lutea TaxID=1607951 RepID=A0A9X1UZZ9_9FLAO|nr:GIY-YIG nuclease family protein [Christiangramia lutea]MCH4821613.1 GIY-YIG nuclease family protein [Christiangramia lutea]